MERTFSPTGQKGIRRFSPKKYIKKMLRKILNLKLGNKKFLKISIKKILDIETGKTVFLSKIT